MRNHLQRIILIILAMLLIYVRILAYEPLGHSISTYDTERFISAGRIPIASAAFFTSDVPATMGLVYKILEPTSGYHVTVLSSPAEDLYQRPAGQPGLVRVAFVQSLLSIGAWLLLASVVVRQTKNFGLQIIAILLILSFGFSPSLAEWDAVQLSEPVSFSLFIIFLALMIECTAQMFHWPTPSSIWTKFLLTLTGFVFILWVFARDTNAFILLVFIPALLFLFVWRSKVPASKPRIIFATILGLSMLFLAQNAAMQNSGRWVNSFFNNILHNVFPYPDRTFFFKERGMPISDEMWALRNSPGNEDGFFEFPELMAWTTKNGAGTYMQFLLAYPEWTVQHFFSGVEVSFSENRQPFFFPDENRTSSAISYIGDLLHPRSSSVIWVDLAGLILLGILSFHRRYPKFIALFFIFLTLFLGEILMLFVSIHGDTIGVVRHALGSVMPLRLSVWLLPLFTLDLYAQQANASPSNGRKVPIKK
jgi:hypothetical protein